MVSGLACRLSAPWGEIEGRVLEAEKEDFEAGRKRALTGQGWMQ